MMPRPQFVLPRASRLAGILTGLAAAWAGLAAAAEPPAVTEAAEPAGPAAASPTKADSPQLLFERAVRLFFADDPAGSAAAFDDLIEARPDQAAGLWQRGLALYYAGRYAEGRRQFELHRTVNPNDVENPAWHFLCLARTTSPEQARAAMLPVGPDPRVPMREILAFYRGDGTTAEVLKAAERGDAGNRRNQLCYAHLYLGLYAEVTGDTAAARDHITQAAGRYGMDHYMGRVAKLHTRLRGWESDGPKPEPAAAEPDSEAAAQTADQARYVGTWRVVSIEANGETSDDDDRRILVNNRADGSWTLTVDGREVASGKNTLDPLAVPKEIDIEITAGDGKGSVLRGIYEFDGATSRRLCFRGGNGWRPAEFSGAVGSDSVLVGFERQ